jgi:predicted amidophosphoribosyltransferase
MGCLREGEVWCGACARSFAARPFDVGVDQSLPVRSLGDYQGPIASLINLAKEKGSEPASRVMASALSVVVQSFVPSEIPGGEGVYLVPVPATKSATRRRGGDPLAEITNLLAADFHPRLRVVASLKNSRQRNEQSGLSVTDRMANARGSFEWVCATRARAKTILIDDVVTTGATLIAAAQAIRDAGLEVIGCATVAATRRRASTNYTP